MGDTLAQRRSRIVQKISAASPPSTDMDVHGSGAGHHVAVNALNLNTRAVTQCNTGSTATITDHDQIAHAEWIHEALGKAQRYWSPA